MDKQKVILIGGAVAVGGIGYFLYHRHVASVAAQDNIAANDAQLAALMMQSPLGSMQPAYSAPSVDTGNTQFQQILDSILGTGGDQSQNTTSTLPPAPPTQQATGNPTGSSTGNNIAPPNAPPVNSGPTASPIVANGPAFTSFSGLIAKTLPLRVITTVTQ